MKTKTNIAQELYLEVSGDVKPFIPATQYKLNGDPGDPAEGGDVDDVCVMLNGYDITHCFTEVQIGEFKEALQREAVADAEDDYQEEEEEFNDEL